MTGIPRHRIDASRGVPSPVHRQSVGRAAALAAVLTVCALVPATLDAQCPDGSPPPCAGARAPAPPDPSRIAVLPFRVTTADTLLGEGVAELVATAFTGENGPRAVHMGTVLRAWRRAGGDLRTPLGQAAAVRVARESDAGQYVEGSVVGLGTRLTLTASVQRVPGGSTRRVGPLSGPADSLESLVGQLASGLLAASGSERQVDTRVRLTGSPEAMQAYLAGLRAFRRLQFEDAAAAFDRASAIDPEFARAAFMRYSTSQWIDNDPSDLEVYARRAWSLRERLSPQDRVLLAAFLGQRYPAQRSPAENLADCQRAVAQLPESPEAHYVLGDYLYHFGRANGIVDNLERARVEFERSLALDSQQTVIQHLIEIGVYTADTALVRRARVAMDRIAPNPAWDWGVAAALGDSARADSLIPEAGVPALAASGSLDGRLPAGPLGRLYRAHAGAIPLDWRAFIYGFQMAVRGRPAEAARAPVPARAVVAGALFADGDTAAGAAAAGRLTADTTRWAGIAACVRAHWLIRTGASPRTEIADLRRRGQGLCAEMLELLLASREGAPDAAARLAAADSLLRFRIANYTVGEYGGYENLVLARLWEARGDRARALAAIRLRTFGLCCQWTAATGAREEGRLAALVGDTTGAVRAYREYLRLRSDAEPVLVPQRDSVRAEVARLAGGR